MLERIMLAATLAVGGCAAPRPVIWSGSDPADPAISSGIKAAAPVGGLGGVPLPVPAGNWEEVNRRVAPGAGGAPGGTR